MNDTGTPELSTPAGSSAIAKTNRPHKGAENYDAADADLFFGRDDEAGELIARVLGSRVTVLYAPSGAGKTSLLNARVKPMLEARGWLPIGVRFFDDPIEAVRAATLQHLLPPLTSERDVLEDAMQHLRLSETSVLAELLESYAAVPLGDGRRRRLVADREPQLAAYPGLLSPFKRVSPYLCRVIRGSLSIDSFARHLEAIARIAQMADGAAPLKLLPAVSATTRLGDLDALLRSDAMESAAATALASLYLPVPGLDSFFQNLVARYGEVYEGFQVVLMLDQFEEIFARYRDPGKRSAVPASAHNDWRHRERFFHEFEALYHADNEGTLPQRTDTQPLPIRYVISLREEYVGRLDRVRLFAPELNDSMFRLGLLSQDQSRRAMTGPAAAFGYEYEASVLEEVWDVLARENLVGPGPVSIVCDQLWEKVIDAGKASVNFRGKSTIDSAALGRAGFNSVTGDDASPTERVISNYFDNVLNNELSEAERVDALDILELLITGTGTRNIVGEELLVNAPFRSTDRRRIVLQKLVAYKLLRTEERLDGKSVEVTHEILIAPMQARVQIALRDARGVRAAERTLEGIRHGDLPFLDSEDFKALDRYASRFEWPAWAVALMLESAVLYGVDAKRLLHWRYEYEATTWPSPEELLRTLAAESRFLTLEEVRRLNTLLQQKGTRLLAVEETERLLQSVILAGADSDHETILRCAGSLLGAGNAHNAA